MIPTFLERVFSRLRYWVWTLVDAAPPYRRVEGFLETKQTDAGGGKHYIWVASTRIEVDSATFELLIVGENMRVLCTKSNRAINIDRLVSGGGPR